MVFLWGDLPNMVESLISLQSAHLLHPFATSKYLAKISHIHISNWWKHQFSLHLSDIHTAHMVAIQTWIYFPKFIIRACWNTGRHKNCVYGTLFWQLAQCKRQHECVTFLQNYFLFGPVLALIMLTVTGYKLVLQQQISYLHYNVKFFRRQTPDTV